MKRALVLGAVLALGCARNLPTVASTPEGYPVYVAWCDAGDMANCVDQAQSQCSHEGYYLVQETYPGPDGTLKFDFRCPANAEELAALKALGREQRQETESGPVAQAAPAPVECSSYTGGVGGPIPSGWNRTECDDRVCKTFCFSGYCKLRCE